MHPPRPNTAGGSGTAQNPYQIATAADLVALGETPADYDKHFLLTADIDLDPKLPGRKVFDRAVIAPDTGPNDQSSWFQGTPFTGVFDGSGHRISHLAITGGDYVGLFGQLGYSAKVRDLGVVDVKIVGSGYYVGGLVGSNGSFPLYQRGGTVTRCCSTGAVSGTGNYVGGLVGANLGPVTDCYSTAAVGSKGVAGGLVGYNSYWGAVIRCYSIGAVSGSNKYVGGLVGASNGAIGSVLHSVWDMETSGLSESAGGVSLTKAEMMDPYKLGLNGFANDPNWVLDTGRDYPRLAWEGTVGQVIPSPKIDWLAGRGTPEEPYRIDTADQLILLGKASLLWDKHFVLNADINLDPSMGGRQVFGQAIIPSFTGVFDGKGHTISHLTIKGGSYLGLFGNLASEAEVKSLGVVDVNVAGSGSDVGGLVGTIEGGTVSQCYSTGVVSGASYNVGGLVGGNGGAAGTDNWYEDWAGVVSNCYSTAHVNGREYVGGLVGVNSGPVTDCYSAGTVSGNDNVGGLVGYNSQGTVTQCYSTGMVSGKDSVGGLVGGNWATVIKCYSTGAVSGTNSVGGLVGYNSAGVTQCYSTGAVSGTGDHVGGLVGLGNGWATGCFWDIQTSGRATSAGGTGKATAEMQTAKTFLDAGWDFVGETANGTEDIWWILEGKDYPRLWWEAAKK